MRQILYHLRMILLVSLFVGGLTLPACVFAKEGTCEVSFPVKIEVEGKDIPEMADASADLLESIVVEKHNYSCDMFLIVKLFGRIKPGTFRLRGRHILLR